MDQSAREQLVSQLNGYLDAAASIDGAPYQCGLSATLVPRRLGDAEASLRRHLRDCGIRLVSCNRGARWTEVEYWLQQRILTAPFADAELTQRRSVVRARYDLAWHASDWIMFLSPGQRPHDIHYLAIEPGEALKAEGGGAVAMEGCAVGYENDLVLLIHSRRRGV